PDMPPEAFRDMWETLKSGEAWAGLVKNRCKNGDFYWVKANVTPVTRDGRAAGYLSVRVAPTPEEVESAEHLYGEMREGRAEHLTMRKGVLLRKGLRSILDLPRTISFARRVRLPLAAVAVAAAYALFTSGASAEAWAAVAGTLAFTALWLESTVVRPVRALAEHSRAVATGAPDTRPVDRLDELGLVTRSVNQIAVMFRWIINDISSQVGAVREASTEIARGNDDLNRRTVESAEKIEECASSMEEMSASVHTNAGSAKKAAEIAQGVARAAADGASSVEQTSVTMKEISDSSSRIREIIGVIDSIAFQTNILALNAAVEAARAGDEGRGFAVVANEVRSLAQRSATAASEIAALIEDSGQRVEAGVSQVDESLSAIEELTAQVRTVHQLIDDISLANDEQSTGVDHVNGAVSALDSTTQQNAKLVVSAADSAARLQRQAEGLAGAVEVFRS
ncbi:MAG: methyl-accepting chemotaxis protein, partial [Planctomycetota bacterium]